MSTPKNSAGKPALPPWALEFLPARSGTRYKIAYGGRGSGKSWAFARMLLIRAAVRPIRVLCARELQNSITDSVYQLLLDQIGELGLSSQFDVQANRIASRCGSSILFKGLRGMSGDATALKSLEGCDILWIEEGQSVSAKSLQTITPTIRKKKAEIWITFNPDQEGDPVYQLASNPPPGSIVRKVNFDENPWFGDTSLEIERAWMQRTDPEAYAHVWLGECRRYTEAQILRGKYAVSPFETPANVDRFLFGADWGFAQDPTALVRCFIRDNRLFIDYEAYRLGCELEQLPDLFRTVPGSDKWPIKADSSRPETISYMQRHGFPKLGPARKWAGSVEDGISFLRSFEEIVIHTRCQHAAEEARLYSYKTDRVSGEVLPVIVSKHDHVIDAVRYSLDGYIKPGATGPTFLRVPGL